MLTKTQSRIALPLATWLMSAGFSNAAKPPLQYNRDVLPILSDRCFKCHGPDAKTREADLRLDVRGDDKTLKELIRRIETSDADDVMPPPKSNLHLSKAEIALLRRWINEGAKYQPHWSLVPPVIADRESTIDSLITAHLAKHGLKMSAEAPAATIFRRASLALTGLSAVAKDCEGYDAFVRRLLASPRFGEHMALSWLDAARYADTNGFYTDGERQAWPWRDWVISAFNNNMPFDQFTVEQLAGDLLPDATTQQRIATGFNRNHMVTNETGIIEEEYRLGYVADRVDTTATVWLGLTMGCARCHDHKYDPITQREYYQLSAAFNNIDETGIVKDVAPLSPAPAIPLPTQKQDKRIAALRDQIKEADARWKTLKPALDAAMIAWEKNALDSLAPSPTTGLTTHFALDGNVKADVSGEIKYEAGARGKAAVFDATQYFTFDDPQPVERDKPFTFSIWIMPGSAPQGCVVSKMDSTAEACGFEIMWYKSQPRINLAHRYGRDGIEVVARQKFGGKQWHHLAISYDGSSKAAGLKVYIDGALAAVDVKRDALTGSVATSEPWRIAWKGTGVGFEGSLDEVRLHDRALSAAEIETMHWRDFLEGTLPTPRKDRPHAQSEKLERRHIAQHGTTEMRELSARLVKLRADEREAREAIVSTSVMQEMSKPRVTHVLSRGQYDAPLEEVRFSVPASLGPLPPDAPLNRLGLARWLVSPQNPLTARVAVNRLWQQCFGEGLLRTTNDFGLQGEPPSHPELLDFLAVRFRDGDPARGVKPWDVKALLELIVTSRTFRQSSNFTPELLPKDSDGRLLARYPRHRLAAETIRDQSLSISGLLVERLGGPSVKPYQPPGLWEAVSYNGDASYTTDHGDALYRRSLYTYWKRQSPPPGALAFDGPTREVCTVRRARTNTPLQALVLLNDVTFVEAARGLAARMMREPDNERVSKGFRIATGREPRKDEAEKLRACFHEQLRIFQSDANAAKKLLGVGESPIKATLDPTELAAWTMTAAVILNLDEVITLH